MPINYDRYRSGPLVDVAMEVLKTREARALFLSKDDRAFKQLKGFTKGLYVRVPPTNRRKRILDLQESAGLYRFPGPNEETTVQVCNISQA